MDCLTPEQRHRAMLSNKSTNTKIEIILRKALWNSGVRYRKNYKILSCHVDIAITKYKIAIFVVILFAVGSTIFTIVGPKILGNATTEIFNGLMSKLSGGSGIDFGKVGRNCFNSNCFIYN